MGESHKALSTKLAEYYVKQRMARLLSKKYTRRIEGGKEVEIGFTTKGNKELLSSTYRHNSPLQRIDLPNIDKLFEQSEYVDSGGLFKPRKDNIVRFHYFKIPGYLHGSTAFLNIAEAEDKNRRRDGSLQTRTSYYVYSVARRIIKNKKPRI